MKHGEDNSTPCAKIMDQIHLTHYRNAIAEANIRNDIEAMQRIIIDIKEVTAESKLEIWRQYYLALAHFSIANAFFKGKTRDMTYRHAKSVVDTFSSLSRQPAADTEIYALLGGALAQLAAGASNPVSKASFGMKSDRALSQALETGAKNPRVLLVHGRSLFLKPRLFGGNKKQGIEALSKAREYFLDQPVPEDPLPAWGFEEACFWASYGLLHFNRFDEARAALAPLIERQSKYYLIETMLSRIDEKEHKRHHAA